MEEDQMGQLTDEARKALLQAMTAKAGDASPDGLKSLAVAWRLARDGGSSAKAEYELSRRIMDRPDLLAAAELLAAEMYQTSPLSPSDSAKEQDGEGDDKGDI
jgi:hypothetical protein